MSTTDATSQMRQAVIAAITIRAAGDPQAAALLGAELSTVPYPARSDHDLFVLAEQLGVPASTLEEAARLDATLVAAWRGPRPPVCDRCSDAGQIARGDGRFARCPQCNPEPRTEEL